MSFHIKVWMERRCLQMENLYFQGYNVKDLIARDLKTADMDLKRPHICLLFGSLPTPKQLRSFVRIVKSLQELSGQFLRDVVMKATSQNQMNALQRCILTLYCYDANPDEVTVPNVLRQSLQLIAKMPQIAVHSYCAWRHFHADDTLVIRLPNKEMSIAENISADASPGWRVYRAGSEGTGCGTGAACGAWWW